MGGGGVVRKGELQIENTQTVLCCHFLIKLLPTKNFKVISIKETGSLVSRAMDYERTCTGRVLPGTEGKHMHCPGLNML